MSDDQCPGHMIRQEGSGNLAYQRDVDMVCTARWKFEGHIKVNLSVPIRRTLFQIWKVIGNTR